MPTLVHAGDDGDSLPRTLGAPWLTSNARTSTPSRVSFFVNWGISGGSDVYKLLHGLAEPGWQPWAVPQAVGTIGAVIMPHNLYLHSGLVLTRKISRHKPQRVHDAICYTRIESGGALLVAFFLNLAIVAVNATNFYDDKCATYVKDAPLGCMSTAAYNASFDDTGTRIPCGRADKHGHVCGDFGWRSEAYALRDALGSYTLYMWALGLFASGQAATMVCTYAGQFIMGGMLQIRIRPWLRVAITRSIALGPALVVAVTTIEDQKLFNAINQYLNIVQ